MTYLFLANGFEELEAITIIDILRRASIPLKTVGIGSTTVEGCHAVKILSDMSIDELDLESIDMLILPGGFPGVTNLKNSSSVIRALEFCVDNGKIISAICAAPSILGQMGILSGKSATCYPGMESELKNANISDQSVCHCNNIITSKGPGTALEFALYLVEIAKSKDISENIRKSILCSKI